MHKYAAAEDRSASWSDSFSLFVIAEPNPKIEHRTAARGPRISA